MGGISAEQQDGNLSSVKMQLGNYIGQPCIADDSDPIQYWNQNKHTISDNSTLALHYLSNPASLDPVERLFSVSTYIEQ